MNQEMKDFLDAKIEGIFHRFKFIIQNLEQVTKGMPELNEKMDRRFDELNKNMDQKSCEVISTLNFLTRTSRQKNYDLRNPCERIG